MATKIIDNNFPMMNENQSPQFGSENTQYNRRAIRSIAQYVANQYEPLNRT